MLTENECRILLGDDDFRKLFASALEEHVLQASRYRHETDLHVISIFELKNDDNGSPFDWAVDYVLTSKPETD